MSKKRLAVVLAGVDAPGYRSLALDYLQAAIMSDPRLDLAVHRFDVDVESDPWWTACRILNLETAPSVVAFPVLCWTAKHVFNTARILKAAMPSLLIVVGGPQASPLAEETLASQPAIDAVVRGEGEFAFADLLHSHARGGDIAGVPGVTARDGDTIVSAPFRELLADLDALPSPFTSPHVPRAATTGYAYVETYRGCPHACAYCYEGKGSTSIRSFSWDRIVADIDSVASVPGMRAFSFIDPVFNLTTDRLLRLSEIMAPHVAKGIRLHTIEVDIERVDEEQATLLKKAGVLSVETGPQTIGSSALEVCGRRFDEERFRSGVRACREAGISVECDLIIGLPGDTLEDVAAGIDFALSVDPGRVQLSTLHVLPGTSLWERAGDLGLVHDPEPPHEVISTRDISFGDLRRLEVLGNAAARSYSARLSIPARSH